MLFDVPWLSACLLATFGNTMLVRSDSREIACAIDPLNHIIMMYNTLSDHTHSLDDVHVRIIIIMGSMECEI